MDKHPVQLLGEACCDGGVNPRHSVIKLVHRLHAFGVRLLGDALPGLLRPAQVRFSVLIRLGVYFVSGPDGSPSSSAAFLLVRFFRELAMVLVNTSSALLSPSEPET